MESKKCKECSELWSCKYLQHRFNTKAKKCNYDKSKVDAAHKKELEDREKILKGEN
jgi:hypothetical protein